MTSLLSSSIFCVLGALLAVALTPLFAHDMWIEPTTFLPESGEIVGVKLRVGQDFLGDPLPRDPALINQFIVEDADGRKPVIGRDGRDPAGFLRVATPGLLVVGYRSNPSSVELTAEKFNQYLKDEGLDAIAALRAGATKPTPKRTRFFRAARRAWCFPDRRAPVREIAFSVSRSNS